MGVYQRDNLRTNGELPYWAEEKNLLNLDSTLNKTSYFYRGKSSTQLKATAVAIEKSVCPTSSLSILERAAEARMIYRARELKDQQQALDLWMTAQTFRLQKDNLGSGFLRKNGDELRAEAMENFLRVYRDHRTPADFKPLIASRVEYHANEGLFNQADREKILRHGFDVVANYGNLLPGTVAPSASSSSQDAPVAPVEPPTRPEQGQGSSLRPISESAPTGAPSLEPWQIRAQRQADLQRQARPIDWMESFLSLDSRLNRWVPGSKEKVSTQYIMLTERLKIGAPQIALELLDDVMEARMQIPELGTEEHNKALQLWLTAQTVRLRAEAGLGSGGTHVDARSLRDKAFSNFLRVYRMEDIPQDLKDQIASRANFYMSYKGGKRLNPEEREWHGTPLCNFKLLADCGYMLPGPFRGRPAVDWNNMTFSQKAAELHFRQGLLG